ncbi:Gfo/Idh/MocA family oxidoreductase [Porticoccaceae bacterium]|nr:Gfo/Idh/MocA family oxidoreductase [Porticoccaceae bacterium]
MNKPRLRFFENSPSQQHITDADKYLYKSPVPSHKIAVIGTGTIGQEHMRVATLLGRAQVYGIYDTQSHSMDVAEENFKALSDAPLVRYDNLESACNDSAVDALFICTPNHTHFEILTIAIRSGKPIFLEKPMATNLEDAAATVAISDAYSAFIQIGLQYRYKAQYIEAFHEALSRRSLGEVKTIAVSECRPPFLDKVGQWNKFNANSGGTLVEKCCHYFDLINLMAESQPVKVYASGGRAVNFTDFEYEGRASDIDDHAFVVIDYANGVRANFTLNMFSPDFSEEMVVTGTQGRLVAAEVFNFHQQQGSKATVSIEAGEHGGSKHTNVTYAALIEQSGHHGATYYEHIAFMDQLEGRSVDAATPLQGLWSMIVASAAQDSMATGQAVDIAPFMQANNLAGYL